MPRNAGIHKSTFLTNGRNQKQVNHSRPERQDKVANLSLHSRHTLSVVRERVNPIEHAMDIAIGDEGEPWDEEKEAA